MARLVHGAVKPNDGQRFWLVVHEGRKWARVMRLQPGKKVGAQQVPVGWVRGSSLHERSDDDALAMAERLREAGQRYGMTETARRALEEVLG